MAEPHDTEMYDPAFPTDDEIPADQRYDPAFPTEDDIPADQRYDPEHPTSDDMIGEYVQQPAAAQVDFAAQFNLDAASDRLQSFDYDGITYLWHRSMPGWLVNPQGGEFLTAQGQPTGRYFLQANLFTRTPCTFGDSFYLVPDRGGQFSVGSYSDQYVDGAVFVPWEHIAQHTYAHMNDFSIKEVHTLWPVGTTEAQVLAALVADLNQGGHNIVWADTDQIKTFFPAFPANPLDRYSADQISDLSEVLD